MITVFDSSNYAQQVFLREAYATLAAQGNILNQDEIDAGKFLSLDGYFAHMAELVSIRPDYVLIPSDEDPFVIDANTREIKVPATSFGKCAGVVGDNMCEIITFTIDRYFDYTDLANARICVQWKLPGADGEEGISHIGLRDLVTTSGKIRFGWPLTKELTKVAGNITFAIRFFKEKTVTDADGVPQNQFVYLFNTKPATIPIVAGLNVSGENVFVEDYVTDLFAEFVENSTNPSYPMPKPVSYVHNLPVQTKIDENSDTMTLRAQATTSGDGHIVYSWYLKESAFDRTDMSAISTPITGEELQFEVNHNDFVSAGTDWSKVPANKQYYIAKSEEIAPGNMERVSYKLVNGKPMFTKLNGDEIPANTELWERYSTLTIVPVPEGSEDVEDYTKITGLYHVGARNVVGDSEIEVRNTVTTAEGQEVELVYYVPGINSTPELISTECYLPTPADIVIKDNNNLNANVFIQDAVNGAILKVTPEKDGGNPMRTYTWHRYANNVERDANGVWVPNEDAVAEIVGDAQIDVATATLNAMEPGWYYVNVNSLLNRDTAEANSSIARVINPPAKPQVVNMEFAPWGLEIPDKDLSMNDWIDSKLKSNPIMKDGELIDEDGYDTASYGSVASLRIGIRDLDSLLESDNISYEWYVIRPDSPEKEGVKITDAMKGPNSNIHENNTLGTNILNIRCTNDSVDASGAFTYYCKITNTLADQSNTFDFKDYRVMFLVY